MMHQPLSLDSRDRERLRILYVAKHARSSGALHAEDGSHATYHAEMRGVLESIGINLIVADGYEALFERPEVDFVIPLLNRGGFLNSEMMLPLLCERHGLPYLGASPIVRGLSDDKHLTKTVARARGVATADWAIFRRFTRLDSQPRLPGERYVVKPNASSASWGVRSADDWDAVLAAVAGIHEEGHDAIVEPFIAGHDIEVSVISIDGRPVILPTMIVEQSDPASLRRYCDKRDLGDSAAGYAIKPFCDRETTELVEEAARKLMPEFMPFDYGRFEFRIDIEAREIQFLEVNLNCNLWSRKTISMAARVAGWSHAELIETILAESLRRNGLLDTAPPRFRADWGWTAPARTRAPAFATA